MDIDSLTHEDAIRELKRIFGEYTTNYGKILVIDDVLTEDECQSIVDNLEQSSKLEKIRHISHEKYGYGIREGKSYLLDNTHFKDIDSLIFDKVATKIYSALKTNDYYRYWINQHDVLDLGYEYCQYTEGQKLHLHVDNHFLHSGWNKFKSEIPYTPFVFASMSLHLNTLSEGGELIFPNQNVTISQKAGRVVVWSPDFLYLHGTNPVKHGDIRHNIVTWYASKNIVGVDPKDLEKFK